MGPAEPIARLVGLFVYPLKSAAGIEVGSVAVDEVGLRHDRQWMLVDDAGAFLSQRTHPRMALLGTALDDAALQLSAPGMEPFALPTTLPDAAAALPPIRVWHTERSGVDCGREAAEWASTFLGLPCRILRAVDPADGARLSDAGFVRASFADAEPALVISTASLADLNARLDEPLPMNRFRPNLVVDGVAPFAEDGWGRVRIGDVRVWANRPCPRCTLTTVDQKTGIKGVEPLRTLATFRRLPDGNVGFGMNVRFESTGVLEVGQPVVG